jgi:hypothetical protein
MTCFSKRWVRFFAATSALCACISSVSQAQTIRPIVNVTPAAPPSVAFRTFASYGTTNPAVIKLSGFADDLSDSDRLLVKVNGKKKSFQSPWLNNGSTKVARRTKTYLNKLYAAGVRTNQFVLAPIQGATKSRFLVGVNVGRSYIEADPRFPTIAGLSSAIGAMPWVTSQWNSAMELTIARAYRAAVMSAVASSSFAGSTVLTEAEFLATQVSSPSNSSVGAQLPPPVVTVANATPPTPPTPPTPLTPPITPAATVTPPPPAPTTGSPSDLPSTVASAHAFDAQFANTTLSSLSSRILPNYTGNLVSIPMDWEQIFTLAQSTPALRQLLFGIVQQAETTLATGTEYYRRPTTLAQIPESMVDPTSRSVGSNQELRALAMSDVNQADFVRSKGVALALAWRYTKQQQYLDKSIAILREVALYRPLQRQGWSLTDPSWTLPAEGDGPNMATSWGIIGIADIMELLGDNIPPDLQLALRDLIYSEIQTVTRAWAMKIPWYTKGPGTLSSNQWIDPNVAVIRGCLLLGDPQILPAYNMASENLARSLTFFGDDGAFLEGVSYAQMSLPNALGAIQRMNATGDQRFDSLPFISNSWKWWVHMLLPGGRFVNCYDSRMDRQPTWSPRTPLAAMVAAMNAARSDEAVSTIRYLFPDGTATVDGIRYWASINSSSLPPQVMLPTYAYFPSQQVLVWRSAFERPSDAATAWALWARGGSIRDSHSQRDQGQVSVYCGNRVVLMECGTPDYSNPLMNSQYANVAGHSVMQVGELTPRNKSVDAPISIGRLDAEGGAITIDTTQAYTGVLSNKRLLSWSRDGKVSIVDTVNFAQPVPTGTELFRFHVGSSTAVNVEQVDGRWVVAWDGVKMAFQCDASISIEQIDWPDQVLPTQSHRALLVRSQQPVQTVRLETTLDINLAVTN